MPDKKKKSGDKVFMDNLSKAVREEILRSNLARTTRTKPALPPPKAGLAKTATVKAPPGRSPAKTAKGAVAKTAKGVVAKTTTAGKATRAAAGASVKKEGGKAAILKELRAILGRLDEEGLSFLLEQAHVHQYNMEADRLDSLRSSSPAAGKTAGASLRIERSESGSSFYVVLNNAWTMFTTEEMAALVRIAHINSDDQVAARGLEAWMTRERRDALSELYRPNAKEHPFCELARVLRKTFKKPS